MNGKAIPLAKRRKGIVQYWRRARGFSLGELKEVGLTIDQARRLGLAVDLRRRSKHEENVKRLRDILSVKPA
ncbi:MAG: ribosomal protein L13e [Thermoproteota archaeon]